MKKAPPAKLHLSLETLRSPSDLAVPKAAAGTNCTADTHAASGCAST